MSLSNMEEQASGDTAVEKQQKEAVSAEVHTAEDNVQKNDVEKKPEEEVKEKTVDEGKKKQKPEPKEVKKNEVTEAKPVEGDVKDEMETDEKGDEATPLKQGLLDKPLVIEGKRERHSVVRLAAATTPPTKKMSFEPSGSGVALGDIEFVNSGISKVYTDNLKALHRLCYGSPGSATTRKRDLRRFNGYPFALDSPEFEKKKAMGMRLNHSEIREARKLLGTEAEKSKADAVTSILKFLQKPEDRGLKVSGPKKRKSSTKGSKSAKKSKKESPKKDKKSAAVAKESDSESEEKSDESEESEKEEEKKPEKSPPQKKQEKPSAEKATPKKAASKNKRPTGIKLKKPAEKTSAVASATSSLSKAETSKWGQGGPSDEQLNAAINELLHSVDLVNCTMKQMCQRISDKFPNLDMVAHKSALKDRVKEALEQMEE